MLDLRRMRLLLEVSRRGSIAAAARALSFTPSAVSQQLAKLEEEAGIALVERGPRSVRLTRAGLRLAAHTEDILERLARAESDLKALARAKAAALRLGTFPTASATIVPGALTRFAREHPGTSVDTTSLDPALAATLLAAEELDVALLWEYDFVPLADAPELALRLLLEDPIHVLVPTAHPAAHRRTVRLIDLEPEPWIAPTPRSSCHPFTRRACEDAGFTPRIAIEVDDYQAMQDLVAGGVGVAFIPELAVTALRPDVAVRPVGFRPPRRRILGAARARTPSPLAGALLDALEASAGERAAQPRDPRQRISV